MPTLPLETYSGQGILVSWDWSGTANVTKIKISRSDYGRSAPYEEVDTVDYPDFYYIDTEANLESFYLLEELNISDEVLYTHPIIWGEELFLTAAIFYEIGAFLKLRSYRERLMFNAGRTIARSSMPDWILDPAPIIEINAPNSDETQGLQKLDMLTTITDTTNAGGDYPDGLKYALDYNGKVYFYNSDDEVVSIKPYDNRVLATYQFRGISNHAVNNALTQALHAIVAQPGVNKYTTVGSAPVWWDRAIICGAAGYLLRQLAVKLLVPEIAIFYLSDATDLSNLDSKAREKADFMNAKSKEYLEEFKDAKEALRIEKYPNIYIISTPEFQLPGGRSRFFREMWKSS
jgi:hypothetical protein